MLYTGKGDDGTTYFFGSKERFGKDTPLVEALGTLDELGALLGIIKHKAGNIADELTQIQENLFIIAAELAGADKHIEEPKIKDMEARIGEIEAMLPPIKTFFIAGTSESSAWLDYARTLARRAERRVVALRSGKSPSSATGDFFRRSTLGELPAQEGDTEGIPSSLSLKYLNRLSSLLYAFARLEANKSGPEVSPSYK